MKKVINKVSSVSQASQILSKSLLLIGMTCVSCDVLAVQGTDFIQPPRYSLIDKFYVNHASGDVSISIDTVAIGGELGLSHAIYPRTNMFTYEGNRGYNDKFAAGIKYRELGSNLYIEPGTGTYSTLWVMSASAMGQSADFLVMRNGEFAPGGVDYQDNYYYEAIGDKRHTLEVIDGERVWTQPDGTRVYMALSTGGAGHAGAATKMVSPNGFTIYFHYDAGVTTNTGYQIKFVDVNEDPGLDPDKSNVVFPRSSNAPQQPLSYYQWFTKNPKYIYAINRAVEYCTETNSVACEFEDDDRWPRATINWPGGMPRAIFIGSTEVSIVNAAGLTSVLRYAAYDAALLDLSDPNSRIENFVERQAVSPRLIAYTEPGATFPTVRYNYENQIKWQTGAHLTSPVIVSYSGRTKSASGMKGVANYSHGDYSVSHDGSDPISIFHTGPDISVEASYVYPGTLHGVNIFDDIHIDSFEASYRNFPLRIENYNGATKEYTYHEDSGNIIRVQTPDTPAAWQAIYSEDCNNPKICNQPSVVIDANANRTTYTYHPQSGQVATITYEPNEQGLVAQTRYFYAQFRAKYINSSGSKVEFDDPIWLKTREEYCRNSNYNGSSCAGNDNVVTHFEYEHDNLHVTGLVVEADGEMLRTCYSYDIYGNRIGETLPKAGLESCN